MKSQAGEHKLFLSTSKMCIDEKEMHFILSDYGAIREATQAWFELFSKLLTFQFDVGCIPPSVC